MAKNQVSTPAAPAAIGPYSQGITATGTAVYVSGQLPIDPATGAFPGEDITSQTRQSIENIKAVLAAAGPLLLIIPQIIAFIAAMGSGVGLVVLAVAALAAAWASWR